MLDFHVLLSYGFGLGLFFMLGLYAFVQHKRIKKVSQLIK